MKSICIIEDEIDIAESIKSYMETKGFNAIIFESCEDYLKNAPEDFNGIYLIDWNLPGIPGLELVKKIRSKDVLSPVFMVSAYNKKEDIIEGLKAGADDYITKPFSFEELELRVENAMTKFGIALTSGSNKSDFQLIKDASAFIKNGVTVNLTAREFIIFESLINNEGKPQTREDLINCFDKEEKMTSRNIDVHVFSLRKKLKEVELVIETVWGKGYKIN